MSEKTSTKLFNYFIFFGMLVCVLIASIINIRNNPSETALQIVVAFGAMFGVTSTILAAQGNIMNFVVGLLGAVIETYVLWKNGVTSMFLLYLFYFIPMDFVGFFQWRKRDASVHKAVKAQRMDGRKWLYVPCQAGDGCPYHGCLRDGHNYDDLRLYGAVVHLDFGEPFFHCAVGG